MSVKKQYLKKEPVCRVTFRISNKEGQNAGEVKIVGEFNNWDKECEPMRKLKSGDFTQTLRLNPGREYQFRYLMDGANWENEKEADKTVPNWIADNEYNSVLVL